MAGMTREGLSIKRQIDVINNLKEEAVPIFQDLVPVGDIVDTSDDSTLGRIIGLYSEPLSELWELAQAVYLAFDPDSSYGTSLDDIVAYGGLTRKRASRTRADVYLYGNVGTEVPDWAVARSGTTGIKYNLMDFTTLTPENCHGVGFVIDDVLPEHTYSIGYRVDKNSEWLNIQYETGDQPSIEGILEEFIDKVNSTSADLRSWQEDGRIWVSGKVELSLWEFIVSEGFTLDKVVAVSKVEAEKVGAYVQEPNTIDRVATPIWGWDSVRNPLSANTGSLEESDEELRERFRNSKAARATNIIESLYASLYSLDGTNNIVIYENETDLEDDKGLPPHSFMAIIDGGLESEIASAIWRNKPAGINSVGNTEVSIVDAYGYIRKIRFSRPVSKPIFIRMDLTKFSNYPQDGDNRVKEDLIGYVKTLTTGEDLIFSRLYTPINFTEGHQVDSLEVSLDGEDWFSSNILVDTGDRITLSKDNILIY